MKSIKGIRCMLGKSAAAGLLGVILSVSSLSTLARADVGLVEIMGGARVIGRLVIVGDVDVGRATVVAPGSVLVAGTVLTRGSELNDRDIDRLFVLTADTHIERTTVLALGSKIAPRSLLAAGTILAAGTRLEAD